MNKEQLKKIVGSHVLLVPAAKRLDTNGFEQRPIDDDWWLVEDVTDDGVKISDPRTSHVKALAYDHLYKYTTDSPKGGQRRGFLTLHVQLIIQGNEIRIVPNARPGEPVPLNRPTVTERVVRISYPEKSGLQKALAAQGYTLGWARPDTVHERIELEGYELVIDKDSQGNLSSFRTSDGLLLLKHRATKP